MADVINDMNEMEGSKGSRLKSKLSGGEMSMTDLKVALPAKNETGNTSFSNSKNFTSKSFLNNSKSNLNQSKILNPTQSKYQQFLERKKSGNQSKLIPSPEPVKTPIIDNEYKSKHDKIKKD